MNPAVNPPVRPGSDRKSGGAPVIARPGGKSGFNNAVAPGRPGPGKLTNEELAAQREALGLGVAKPSEMVAGLEAAANRAEKLDAREAAKRKGGGTTLNVALHVDDTGKRWSRIVLTSLVLTVLFVFLAGALMIFLSSRTKIPAEEGNSTTSNMLRDIALIGTNFKITRDEKVSVESARAHLTEAIQAELEKTKDQIKSDEEVHHPPSATTIEWKHELEAMLNFQDAWSAPFQFAVEGDKVTITAKGKTDAKGRAVEPKSFQFLRAK